jgi:hypothetical protein
VLAYARGGDGSCYNGAQMRSGYGRERVCASLCAWGRWKLCEISCLFPSWPPLLALIWGARSQDPVQVDYRCMRTLISLGFLGL